MITAGPWSRETVGIPAGLEREWLVTDGLGGYAMGTVAGVLTRGYHGLLTVAARPPRGRVRLLAQLLASFDDGDGEWPLWSQEWAPQVFEPNGHQTLWRFWLEDGMPVWEHQWRGVWIWYRVVMPRGRTSVLVSWQWRTPHPITLRITPLVSGRDHHSMGGGNTAWQSGGDGCSARWGGSIPDLHMRVESATFHPNPVVYQHVYYRAEAERGLSPQEDLWAAGSWTVALPSGSGVVRGWAWAGNESEPEWERDWTAEHDRRSSLVSAGLSNDLPAGLVLTADAFRVANRQGTPTVIAGYPWFTDWGRDTFIALPGLARVHPQGIQWGEEVLRAWGEIAHQGLLPNRFPDDSEEPEWTSVDAVLWWIVRVWEWGQIKTVDDRVSFWSAMLSQVDSILSILAKGTCYGIQADSKGWLAAGHPSLALTWMDARVGDWVVTPRRGYPVEVNALWVNALYAREAMAQAVGRAPKWLALAKALADGFSDRFLRPDGKGLVDVIGTDGTVDASLRPNQLLALALPWPLIPGGLAKSIVNEVETHLFTPLGLYSLDPWDPAFRPRFTGPPAERDAAYHQGAIWPFLLGSYLDAWNTVDPAIARQRAQEVWSVLLAHLDEAGLGSISEVLDPTTRQGRGCPFQAWSVAEALRIGIRYLDSSSEGRA